MLKHFYENLFLHKAIAVIIIIIFGLVNIEILNGIILPMDEFGYFGIGALMSGLEWPLMSTMFFYSYGYSFLLVPFFLLGISTGLMYKLMVILNVLFLAASFILTCFVANRIFPKQDKRIHILVCLAVTLFANNISQVTTVWPETLLYLLFWCISALMIQVIKENKLSYYLLLALSTVYMYTVHSRTVVILIVVVAFLLFLYVVSILEKKPRHLILLCLASIIVLFFIASLFRQYTIVNYFTAATNQAAAYNDYESTVERVKQTYLNDFFYIVISFTGKIFSHLTATFLLIIFPFIIAVRYITKQIYLFIKRRTLPAWDDGELFILFISTAFIAAVLLSASAAAASGNEPRAIDLFLYERYSDYAIGPMILAGFCLLRSGKKDRRDAAAGFSGVSFRELIGGLLFYVILGITTYIYFRTVQSVFFTRINNVSFHWFFANDYIGWRAVFVTVLTASIVYVIFIGGAILKKQIKNTFFLIMVCIIGIYWGMLGADAARFAVEREEGIYLPQVVATEEKLYGFSDDADIYYVRSNNDFSWSVMKLLQTRIPQRPINVVYSNDIENLQKFSDGDIIISGVRISRIVDIDRSLELVHVTEDIWMYILIENA